MPYFTDEDLAEAVRSERVRQGLTQTEVADRLAESGLYERITKQAVSLAENYRQNDGMNSLRVALYEVLTGRKLTGPVWYYEEEGT